jgi:hypothetical protein
MYGDFGCVAYDLTMEDIWSNTYAISVFKEGAGGIDIVDKERNLSHYKGGLSLGDLPAVCILIQCELTENIYVEVVASPQSGLCLFFLNTVIDVGKEPAGCGRSV